MLQVIDRLRCKSNRNSTRKTYHRIWTTFNKFLIRLDDKPQCWEERVTIFIAYLIEQGRQSSTIKSYVSAIKNVLMTDGYEWSDSKILLTSLTRACKLENDIVKTRLPIHGKLLDLLLFEVERAFDTQPFLRAMYMAFFALSYYGLFRVGELAESEHAVKAKDVHVAKKQGKNFTSALYL